MRTMRLSLVGTVIVALLGGLGGATAAQPESDGGQPHQFPTGVFVPAEEGSGSLEFNDDWTGRSWDPSLPGPYSDAEFTYAVGGDLYAQTSFNFVGEPREMLPPAIYHWRFDGEYLSFELACGHPDRVQAAAYTSQPWRYVPDARLAVVAASDIEAGAMLWMGNAELVLVPGADVPDDALTDPESVYLATATVQIPEGQPITPAMLEPPAE